MILYWGNSFNRRTHSVIELTGDFWDHAPKYDAICCTTNYIVKNNGELVMGAGIAKEFAQRYPWLPKEWGRRVSHNWKENCHPGLFVTLMPQKPYLVYFGTKWHWKDPSDLNLVVDNAWSLFTLAYQLDWQQVLLPRPGCAHGGLNWTQVKSVIDFLDDRFHVITKV